MRTFGRATFFARSNSLILMTTPFSNTKSHASVFKRFSLYVAASSCLVLLAGRASAAQYGDFTYSTGGINATITGYTGAGGDVAIPANINGYRVAYIGGYAFFGNSSITNIDMTGSVISIAPSAFFYCVNLVSFNVDPANSQLSSLDGVLFDKSQHTLVQCPAGKSGNYTIPGTVSTVQSDAFIYCDKLTQIIVPPSVTSIGNQAFDYATNINAFFFLGNTPSVYSSGFASNSATVFYLPGTSGWGPTFAGRPTTLWNPRIQLADANFGMQTNGFSFNITGNSNLVVVVEACTSLIQSAWTPLGTNTLVNGASSFHDSGSTSLSSRYYRLRSP